MLVGFYEDNKLSDHIVFLSNHINNYNCCTIIICNTGAKDDWDFRISVLVKNPDGTDI